MKQKGSGEKLVSDTKRCRTLFWVVGHIFHHSLWCIFAIALLVTTPLRSQSIEVDNFDTPIEYEDGAFDQPSNVEPEAGPFRLNLDDCVKLALEHNGKIQGKISGIEAAQWQKKEANGFWKPRIDYEYQAAGVPADLANAFDAYFNGDWSFFNRAKITLGVPVFAFGQFKLAQQLAEQGLQKSFQDKHHDDAQVVSEVKQLFYGILLAEELHSLLDTVHDEVVKRIGKEEKDLEHSPFQLMQLKLVELELEKRMAEVDDKEILAKAGMRLQLDLPPEAEFSLARHKLRPISASLGTLEDYIKVAQQYRPEAQMVDIGVHAKTLEYQLEKRKMLPGVGVGGFAEIGRTTSHISGVSAQNPDPFNFTRGGLGLEVRGKLDFFGSHARIKRLEAEVRKAQVESQIAKRGINLDVEESYLIAKRAGENLVRADQTQTVARRMLFLATSNLDIGVGDEKDYVEALKIMVQSRGEYFKSVFDFNVSLAKLDEKIGVGGSR